MTPDDFRQLGHRFIDYIADYWARVGEFPVLSQVKPGDVLSQLPQSPPQFGLRDALRHAPRSASSSSAAPAGEAPESSRAEGAFSTSSSSSAWDPVFRDLDSIILPGLTHWQSPRFFAYFPCNASPPAVLAELLSAGLNVQGMLWATSPACTELETRVMDWLAEMIGLPDRFKSTSDNGGGVIQGTASEATLVAMIAARDRARRALQQHRPPESGGASVPVAGPSSSTGGASPSAQYPVPNASSSFTLYTSTQAHSSVIKAAMITGLIESPDDRSRLRLIDTDEKYAMRPDALEAAMRADIAAGLIPIFVCASVGTTSTTAVDPIGPIADAIAAAVNSGPAGPASVSIGPSPLATRPLPWLHVDAAHAGAACVCPEHRWMLDGIERADSLCFNPHKWLLTNFDCDAFWAADRRSLTAALSIMPEYLRNQATDAGDVIDYRDWQIPLGRRFRALKLWFVIRHYGVDGLRAHIRAHVDLAAKFESWVRSDPRFEIAAPRTLNLVCFRLRSPSSPPPAGHVPEPSRAEGPSGAADINALNKAMLDSVNATGRVYLSHTVLPGRDGLDRYTLRMAIGATTTREPDLAEAWSLLRAHAQRLLAPGARFA